MVIGCADARERERERERVHDLQTAGETLLVLLSLLPPFNSAELVIISPLVIPPIIPVIGANISSAIWVIKISIILGIGGRVER